MKRVLITGGAGFIGSHLCKHLLEKGYGVICLDNFFTGNKQNIAPLLSNPDFKVVPHDITESLIKIKGEIGYVDEIYNLACPASPIHYQFDPIETIKANTIGVVNVLEFAKLNSAKTLQASTSEVYGDPLEHPQKETYRGNVHTLGPRACYDEGKRVAESLFINYYRKFNLPIRMTRIFNTYGPNMSEHDGRVVSNFIVQALKHKPITIFGDGKQTRSFCYVDDLIRGLYLLMNSKYISPVNLGNPDEFTILDLANKVKEITNSRSEIEYVKFPEDDPLKRNPDISLARALLNWQPTIGLDEGLKKTIGYFQNKQNNLR